MLKQTEHESIPTECIFQNVLRQKTFAENKNFKKLKKKKKNKNVLDIMLNFFIEKKLY